MKVNIVYKEKGWILEKIAKKLEAEIAQLGWNQKIRWFLSGAGVLFFGFLIGFFSKL